MLVPYECQVEPSRDVYVQDKIQGARLHFQVHQGLFPADCVVTVCHRDEEPTQGNLDGSGAGDSGLPTDDILCQDLEGRL